VTNSVVACLQKKKGLVQIGFWRENVESEEGGHLRNGGKEVHRRKKEKI